MIKEIRINYLNGCSVCGPHVQEFNSKEEAIKTLESDLDNWYFDCPEYAEHVVCKVLDQVREDDYDEVVDEIGVITIDTSDVDSYIEPFDLDWE